MPQEELRSFSDVQSATQANTMEKVTANTPDIATATKYTLSNDREKRDS